MKINQLQQQINQLKKETDSCILAHSYMNREIVEIADYTGDSYQIAVNAKETVASNIIVCGVRFMAETAKILNPEKRVFLSNPEAGCPMAEQFTAEDIIKYKQLHPDRAVVAYINTTAELKSHCDVCVTSSSAVKIVENMEAEKILFIPDCNLGDFINKSLQKNRQCQCSCCSGDCNASSTVPFKNKDIMLVEGGCPVHGMATFEDVNRGRTLHPNALLLVHPECHPEVVESADYVGSTGGIMEFAKSSENSEFIIGTEMSIREHLQYECPEKSFYPLSRKISCPDMRMTSLVDIYLALKAVQSGDSDYYEIQMSDDDVVQSRKCIDEMLRLGKI